MNVAANGGVSLVSTNYDILVEQELYRRIGYEKVFTDVDFGTRVREPISGVVHERPKSPLYRIFKLHGSLNWLRCELCDNVYVNPVGGIAYLSFLLDEEQHRRKKGSALLERLNAAGANTCHCGHKPLRHVMVAPSLVRDIRDTLLLSVWRNAFEALRCADEWIIVGYSLPPEDLSIRSMFLRASCSRESQRRHRRVVVVQKGEVEPERTRYQMLFPDHEYVAGALPGYLKKLS